MRIGYITPEYVMPGKWEGGLANYLRKICFILSKRGHKPVVFVLSNRDAQWQDEQIVVYEVKKAPLPQRARFHRYERVVGQYLNARRLASSVWRVHRSAPFDIIQASSFMAPGYKLLGNGRIPVVCRISSYMPLLRSASGRQRNFADYLGDWLEMRQVLDADASFAPSYFMANTFARFEGLEVNVIRSPLELLKTNLDPAFYLAHLKDRAYLLFFGTLSRVKGIDLLSKVIPDILQIYPALSFVFIGRNDVLPDGQKMFDFLCQECHAFRNKLHYWPAMPKANLYPVIANALGVLMPSRVDNYPNACLEAQSLGVPVIGSNNSSLEEIIIDGETGFLAINGDPASLAEAIKRLLNLTQLQREQMIKNIQGANQAYHSEDRAGQLVAYYQKIIDSFQVSS